MLNEGYIGYSNNPMRRFSEHKAKNSKMKNIINKYKDTIELIIVETFDNKEDALSKEKTLRPKKRIGWNIAVGGQIPPDNKNNIDVRTKISNKIKELGVVPYCKNTHSKESLAKAAATKKLHNKRMFHDPITGDYKLIALGLNEQIPNGWVPGRVKKPKIVKKIRGKDYICNTKTFTIIDPLGNEHSVSNLKQWCKDQNIPYLATFGKRGWKGWYIKEKA